MPDWLAEHLAVKCTHPVLHQAPVTLTLADPHRLSPHGQVALQLIEDQSVRDAAVFDMQLLDNAGGSGGSGGNGGGNTNGGSGGASTNGGGSRKQRKGNSGGGSPGQAYCNNCEAGAAAGDGGRGCKAAALLQQPQLLQPQ